VESGSRPVVPRRVRRRSFVSCISLVGAGAGALVACDAPPPGDIHSEPAVVAPVGAREAAAQGHVARAQPPLPAAPADERATTLGAGTEPGAGVGPANAVTSVPGGHAPASGEGWNDGLIAWRGYDDGLAEARRSRKPVLLVLHAEWCSHCRTYSRVFSDPRVVAKSRELVMVRVDVDRSPQIAARFAIDGTYVPRTFFLNPDGVVLPDIDARRPRYRYFFDEHDPASILAGMETATSRAMAARAHPIP
jgi:thiol-disulfide isomerase/thioredoxin